ncbi:MAG: hypothetical protein HY013_13035 [Candidatus Solibacter usitatus]|nr:hypothetical protein [Candidatus Solibacter usitatus]
MDTLSALYQQFDPLRPLEVEESDLYVDWQRQCGPEDIKKRLANSIAYTGSIPVTRLFTGHRGVGKTTELKRVKHELENRTPRRFVSLLQAADWVDLGDVQPPDLVLHIVRQLVTDLKDAGFGLGWTKFIQFFAEIKDILSTEVELKNLKVGGPVEFGIAIKDVPGARGKLRKLLEDRLPTIYDLINKEVLRPAREWLTESGYDDLVVIVDQLDRIPQKVLHTSLTNHENLFLDNAGTLRALNCHMLFTIPIELAYSRCRGRLGDVYGSQILTLPVIPVTDRGRKDFSPGLDAMRKIAGVRAARAGVTAGFFEDDALLDQFCRLSGGHVRSLFILLRSAIERSDTLPLTRAVAERTIRRAAADLVLPLQKPDWEVLREVHQTKEKPQDPARADIWHGLLRDLFVFGYEDDAGIWYDWNPLLGAMGDPV